MEKNTPKKIIFIGLPIFVLLAILAVFYFQKNAKRQPALVFLAEGIIEEAEKMSKSASPDWWLNSGGVMEMKNGWARTNFGALAKNSRWQKLYAKNNPRDTDSGYYPQNIFRLVTRGSWQDLVQEVYFNIDKINLSASDYRGESNGILLFNRYQDGDNLYYTGLRVDGHAVIKKKIGGKYYTLAEKDILSGGKKYDRNDNPNFLPLHQWIGIRSEVSNSGDNTANIKLFVDLGPDSGWKLVLETKDKGSSHGKTPFLKAGRAGIRTDFMDVAFQNYKIQ